MPAWVKAAIPILALAAAASLIAWGALRTDVRDHGRRIGAVEIMQTADGRKLSSIEAKQIMILEGLKRIEEKLP